MRLSYLLAIFTVLLLAGCAAKGEVVTETPLPPTATTRPTDIPPTPEPPPTATSTPVGLQLSFEPATYSSESAGFELQVPASWTPSGEVVYSEHDITSKTFIPACETGIFTMQG